MSVFHVTLMIWVVPWVASNSVLRTSTPASSEPRTGQLHFVESHFASKEEKSSDGEDSFVVIDSEKNSDSEDFVFIPSGNGSYAEEAAPNRLGKMQIDDNGNLPEENRTLDKKMEKNYIWVHAGISSFGYRNYLFDLNHGRTAVCLIQTTHEDGIVRLRVSCLVDSEKLIDVEKIPMRTILEEAAKIVWDKPSAKIIELLEQFKNESAFYVEKMRLFYAGHNAFDSGKFGSKQISKIATIYNKVHPESMYSHVHTYKKLLQNYFYVHT